MKAYRIKIFDVALFNLFYPTSPGGFVNKDAAETFCEAHNALKGDLYYAYDEIELSEVSAEDIKKSMEELTP